MAVNAHAELEKLTDHDGAVEHGYAPWKLGKVETGLAQSKKHSDMIPAYKVARDYS